MTILKIAVLGFYGLCFVTWISGLIWIAHPFKAGKWFFHDILGRHRPDDETTFDGLSEHRRCIFCNEEIMQDSKGNWFTF